MSLSYEQRIADPRWAEAGNLFDAQLGQQPYWARLSAHARDNIRYATQQAALGVPDSGYADPDASLAQTVETFVKLNAAGEALLAQCRAVARSAAQAAGRRQDPAPQDGS